MMGYDSVLNRFNFAEGDFNVSSLGINLLRHTNTYSIKIDAGSATVPPIQLASGTLNTTPQIGAMEFLTDDLYFGLTTPSSIISTSFYPPAQSATYVKSGYLNSSFYSWFATDPTTSVTGTPVGNGWQNTSGQQRFHIDLGSGKIVDRVYYENKHSTGLNTDRGVKDFTLWGSNSSTAFANLTYGTDTDWTELTCDTNVMLEHTGSDIADPNYILVTNITSYRYYAFKFSSNHGSGSYYGIRQLELQSITTADYRRTIVMSDDGLTSGKIPIADIGGRLKDGPTPLAGTKIYYVSDSSGGAVTRKLTFTDGILTSET